MTITPALLPAERKVLDAAYRTAQASAELSAARKAQHERPHAIMPAAETFRNEEHNLSEAVRALVTHYEQELDS